MDVWVYFERKEDQRAIGESRKKCHGQNATWKLDCPKKCHKEKTMDKMPLSYFA